MTLELYLYLKKNKIRAYNFCKEIGCSREHLSQIMNGRANPSERTAMAIELATNGEIKKESLMKKNVA